MNFWGCFEAQTAVAVGWRVEALAAMDAGASDLPSVADGLGHAWNGVWLVMAGATGVAAVVIQRRRRRDEEDAVDDVFRQPLDLEAEPEAEPARPGNDDPDEGECLTHTYRRATLGSSAAPGEKVCLTPHESEPCLMGTLPESSDPRCRRRTSRHSSAVAKVASAILFLLCGISLWQAAPARQKPDVFSTAQAAVTPSANRGTPSQPTAPRVAQRTLVTRAIEDLRPGMRVIAENPELAGQDVPETHFNPTETRLVRLRMQKPDGGTLDIETLRTTDQLLGWAWERLAAPDQADPPAPLPRIGTENDIFLAETLLGHTVDLDLPELGAAGPSRILAIEPCPELEPDDGTSRRLVTSTFRHSAANLLDVQIGEDHSPIGVTSNHPFWSADRQAFIPAGQLREGEWLRRADQTPTQVTRITPRRGPPVSVYNIEVDGQHVFHVGSQHLLVHNTCYTTSGVTVLGHFPGYITKAKDIGASYFNIGKLWNRLTPEQQWARNTKFLDKIIAKGDKVLVSVPKQKIAEKSTLEGEIAYLLDNGYKWINQWTLVKK